MTVIKIENVFNYNGACEMLYKMMVDVAKTKTSANGIRTGFYDTAGHITAEYNEKTEVLKVYNYNTHSDLVGKVLAF